MSEISTRPVRPVRPVRPGRAASAGSAGGPATGDLPSTGKRRTLLAAAAAGPAFMLVGLAEAVLREGFDLTRHSWSLLVNGDGGWVHQLLMIGAGLLTVAGGWALRGRSRPRPVPWLIVGYGTFLALAGTFKADAMDGFPVGTPAGVPESVTLNGMLHLATGGVAFMCLIIACLLVGRRLRRRGSRWGLASTLIGVIYLAAFAGISTGAGNTVIILGFVAAVTLGWTWLTVVFWTARTGRMDEEN